MALDFNSTTPAAPAGKINLPFVTDGSGKVVVQLDAAGLPVSTAGASADSAVAAAASSDATSKASAAQSAAIAAAASDATSKVAAHASNTANPHSTTKAQVGLGNVDNTSDAAKPVSTAQAAADSAVQTSAAADATSKANAARSGAATDAAALYAADLSDVTVSGTSGQLTLGKTNNVVGSGAYTSPALPGTVGTPPARFSVRNTGTTNSALTLPNEAGTSVTATILPSEVLTFRQKSTNGWGVESGNKTVASLAGALQPLVALTYASSIATDASLLGPFSVTLTGNATLANPTNLVAGASYAWIVKQDATGGRTLAYGTLFTFPGGTKPTLSTAANAVDVITAIYDGTALRCSAALTFS